MKRTTKKEIFAKYGIDYKRTSGNEYIYYKEFGYIPLLLVNGNEKIGKGIYHFSTLPTNQIFNVVINGKSYDVKGTCGCSCVGCYAMTGNYRYDSVKQSLAIKTWLVWNDIDFLKRAIMAQLEADKIEFLRIHASGDFANNKYIKMFQEIVAEFQTVTFWTYTKNKKAEKAFDSFENANIVKSMIPHYGMNYGHIDYIISLYNELKRQGKKVYICRCGIDKNQHCTNCKACSKNEYVLFIEHSTEYKAEKDILYPQIVELINAQEKQ